MICRTMVWPEIGDAPENYDLWVVMLSYNHSHVISYSLCCEATEFSRISQNATEKSKWTVLELPLKKTIC